MMGDFLLLIFSEMPLSFPFGNRDTPWNGGTSMNAMQKEAIRQMRYQQLGYAHIARELGLPVNTVKSHCFRNGLTPDDIKAILAFCQCCGKPISEPSRTRPRKFCSNECKTAWWNQHRYERQSDKLTDYVCSVCGKTFTDYGHANRRFCSQDCYRNRGEHDEC